MKKLTEGDVERLLWSAADWEPTAAAPPMRLAVRRHAWNRPATISACLTTLAAVAAAVYLPKSAEMPGTPPALTPQPIATAQPLVVAPPMVAPPKESRPVVPGVRLASNPPRLPEPRVRDNDEPTRPKKSRKNWIGGRRRRLDSDVDRPRYNLASSRTETPETIVPLEDTKRIVPVVVTERDAETGEYKLVAGAALVSENPHNTYSLE